MFLYNSANKYSSTLHSVIPHSVIPHSTVSYLLAKHGTSKEGRCKARDELMYEIMEFARFEAVRAGISVQCSRDDHYHWESCPALSPLDYTPIDLGYWAGCLNDDGCCICSCHDSS